MHRLLPCRLQRFLPLFKFGDVAVESDRAAVGGAPLADLHPAVERTVFHHALRRVVQAQPFLDPGIRIDARQIDQPALRRRLNNAAEARTGRHHVGKPLLQAGEIGIEHHQLVPRVIKHEPLVDAFDRIGQQPALCLGFSLQPCRLREALAEQHHRTDDGAQFIARGRRHGGSEIAVAGGFDCCRKLAQRHQDRAQHQ